MIFLLPILYIGLCAGMSAILPPIPEPKPYISQTKPVIEFPIEDSKPAQESHSKVAE